MAGQGAVRLCGLSQINTPRMSLRPFALERYFAAYEMTVPFLFSSSDCEPLSLDRLLTLADQETRELWTRLRLGYTDSQGLPALRAEISRLYGSVSADDVVVVVPEEGILLAMQALLKPGDHVIATFPGYQSLYELARNIGCEIDYWMPDEQDGWSFDPAGLDKLVRSTTRLLVVNFPHNPTGYLPTLAEFQRVVTWAQQHGIRMFSDEMYRLLEFEPADRLPSAVDCDDRAVALFGMSKAFGLAGLRIGWLATRDRKVLGRVKELKDYTTICASAPAEVLALIGLRARATIVGEHLVRILRNLALLEHFVADHPAVLQVERPRAGSVCLARLMTGERASAFCERIVDRAGIMVLPSTVFEFGDQHIRIGLGRENFPDVLRHFEQYVGETLGEGSV
jgi:aspartate/methionine/tyrosine aminotransferase